jgi:hypothetical protein
MIKTLRTCPFVALGEIHSDDEVGGLETSQLKCCLHLDVCFPQATQAMLNDSGSIQSEMSEGNDRSRVLRIPDLRCRSFCLSWRMAVEQVVHGLQLQGRPY